MFSKKMKLKKFNIKYNFLYLSLHNFLKWREISYLHQTPILLSSQDKKLINSLKYKMLNDANTKIDQKPNKIIKTRYNILNSNLKLKRITKQKNELFTKKNWFFLKHSILNNSFNKSFILSKNSISNKLLPHRKSFLSYWGFPLLSFVSLTFYNLGTYSSLKLWPNLENTKNIYFLKNNNEKMYLSFFLEKNNTSSITNLNSFHFKDYELSQSFLNSLYSEKKELENLTALYISDIQKSLFNFEESEKTINHFQIDKNSRNSWLMDFLYQNLIQRSAFYWKWYFFENLIYSKVFLNKWEPKKVNFISKFNSISVNKNNDSLVNYKLQNNFNFNHINQLLIEEKQNPIVSYLRGGKNLDEMNKLLLSYLTKSEKILTLLNITKSIETKIKQNNKNNNFQILSNKLSTHFDTSINYLITNVLNKKSNIRKKSSTLGINHKVVLSPPSSGFVFAHKWKLKVETSKKLNFANLEFKKNFSILNLSKNDNLRNKSLMLIKKDLLIKLQKILLNKYFLVECKNADFEKIIEIQNSNKIENLLFTKRAERPLLVYAKSGNQNTKSLKTMFKELKNLNNCLNNQIQFSMQNLKQLKILNSKKVIKQKIEQNKQNLQILLIKLLNNNLQTQKNKKKFIKDFKIKPKEIEILKLQESIFLNRSNSMSLKWKNEIQKRNSYDKNTSFLNLNLYSKKKSDILFSELFLNSKNSNFLYNNSIKRYATLNQINKLNHSNYYFLNLNENLNKVIKNFQLFEQTQRTSVNKLNVFSEFMNPLLIKLSNSLFFPYFKTSGETTNLFNYEKINSKQFRFLETSNDEYYILNNGLNKNYNLQGRCALQKVIFIFKKFRSQKSLRKFNNQSVTLYQLKKIKKFRQQFSLKYDKIRKNEKIFRSYLSIKNNEMSNQSIKNNTSKMQINDLNLNSLISSEKASLLKLLKNKILKSQKEILPITTIGNYDKSIKVVRDKNKNFYANFNSSLNLKYSFLKEKSTEKNNELRDKKPFQNKLDNLKRNIKYQNSPNTTLQKLGFIFFKKAEKIKNVFNKGRSTSQSAPNFIKRIEQQKYQQKKRRRKKQKLENRRRKKRKRFFPRPIWLRFQMYNKYQKIRHLLNVPKGLDSKTKINIKSIFNTKKYFHLKQKNENNIKSKIYRLNKQQWGFNAKFNKYFEKERNILKNSFNFTNFSDPIFINHDLFQISNKVMSDFQQQCWKSYWLRSNLTTYIRRVQQSLNNIRQKEIQNYSSLTLRQYFLSLIGIYDAQNDLDIHNLYSRNISEKFLNKKSNKLLWYLNIKNSIESQQFISTFSYVQNLQNTIQYNRLIYDRISDIIKNVKVNLNIQGQNNTKSFKRNRHKTEKQLIKSNFWTNFEQNFNPEINRAVSSFFSDSSLIVKPYGDLPSLRLLWALNKTQIFAFKPNTELKNIWLTVKNREQSKTNKTKKFFRTSWKKIFSSNFQNIINQSKELITNQKGEVLRITPHREERSASNQFKLRNFITNFNEFNGMSIKKIHKINKKLRFLGLSKENLNTELHSYKQKLKKLNSLNRLQKENQANFISKNKSIHIIESQSQKYIYRSEQFWWSIKNQNYDLLSMFINSSNHQIEDFSTLQSSYFLNTLWAGTILFHISFLFTFLRLPEIRSLMKFNLLLLYKISNSYLIIIYFIYNNLKTFKGGLYLLFNSLIRFTLIDTNSFSISNNSIFYLHSPDKYKNLNENNKAKNFSTQKRAERPRNFLKFKIFSEELNKNDFNLINSDLRNENLTLKEINEQQFLINLKERLKQNQMIKNINLIEKNESTILQKFKKENMSLFFIETLFYSPNIKTILNSNINWQFLFSSKSSVYDYEKNFGDGANQIKMNKLKIEFLKIQTFNRQLNYLSLISFKFITIFVLNSTRILRKIFYKTIEMFENFLLIIYKFLEKPAELMIEWIGQIFLIEWSSDIMSFVPETLDIYTWKTMTKFSRSQRIFGIFGFLYLRRVLSIIEILLESITKADTDLIIRQRKGILFWDIWGELLIQAAEKYNINIPSLTTLKEEQEMLIERLLDDNDWSKFVSNSSVIQISPLLSMLETTPRKLSAYSSNQENLLNVDNNLPALKIYLISQLNKKMSMNLNNNIQILSNETNRSSVSILNNSSKFNLDHVFLNNTISPNPFEKENNFKEAQNDNIWKRWSINQYFTYQGTDTDLFIDINPPKSFSHMSTLKYYEPAQQALGPVVCQIYSGLFQKQVSRNVLVVGAPGTAKSLLIQALAGETEFKIIIDNANRYALVQRGIAVGMKLLRDVFDAIALHTPCLFLLEDIHVIGERRSMLISDDENAKASQSHNFTEQEEVHEKNQILYQFSKHSISYYKKPYKGDFEFLVPTNQFCFDLFLGMRPPRSSQITPRSPLSLKTIESHLTNSGQLNSQTADSPQNMSGNNNLLGSNRKSNYMSQLELPKETYFAPSATSPFTILVMKEQKKLRPTKLVKEMPWGSFSWTGAKMLLIPKTTYSIRVKIALLADITIRNMSVKLDMITDLLVIMDSVRSNFGFIVFATTHVPYILDPALRRPGRLDETISLAIIPNLLTRWEILRMNLINFASTFDCLDYGLLTSNLISVSQRQGESEAQITNFISKAKLLLFNKVPMLLPQLKKFETNKNSYTLNKKISFFQTYENNQYANLKNSYPIYSVHQAMNLLLNFEAVDPHQILNRTKRVVKKQLFKKSLNNNKQITLYTKDQEILKNSVQTLNSTLLNAIKSFEIYPSFPTIYSSLISNSYSQISQFLIQSQLLFDHTSYKPIFWSKININELNILGSKINSNYKNLYSSKFEIQDELIRLLSSQIGEFFVQNNSSLARNSTNHFKFLSFSKIQFSSQMRSINKFENYLFTQSFFIKGQSATKNKKSFEKYTKQQNPFVYNLQNNRYNGLWSLAGTKISNTGSIWNSATSFINQLVQKRYLYNKNLLMTKMFFFEDQVSLRQAPSPPSSSILMPAKKFENLKRMEKDYQEKPTFLIYEKIQIHQQQKLMKELYNKPVITYFKSQNIKNRYTSFLTAFKELGYKNSKMNMSFPSSSDIYQKNKILTRHKFSLINQWWNSQFAEHNSETTFLSDVDWRSMFVDSSSFISKKQIKGRSDPSGLNQKWEPKKYEKNKDSLEKLNLNLKHNFFNLENLPYNNAIELTIDFPDTLQYYNPRYRRWFLNSTFSNYWLNFEKSFSYEIYNHNINQSFNKTFTYLDQNREILDYFSYIYLRNGQLIEIDLLTTLARFYIKNTKVKKI